METTMYEQLGSSVIAGEDLIEVTNTLCETLLGVAPYARTTPLDGGARISAFVSITGAWEGDVEVRLSPALAARLVREVLELESVSTDDPFLRDIVGEVANIIGGNLKALLPEPCRLSLPTVREGVRIAHPDTLRAFMLGDEPFEVAIGRREVPGGTQS
jgi:chemotaxis protein CheX